MSEPGGVPPRIALGRDVDEGVLRSALREHLCPILADVLPRRRWFGDKERAIVGVGVVDATVVPVRDEWYVLAILDVRFADGGHAEYFVPLGVTAETGGDSLTAIAVFDGGGEYRVVDALALPTFRAWLLGQLGDGAELAATAGTFRWWRAEALARFVEPASSDESRLLGGEQSNSAVVYGEALVVKCFRRLRPGINPDEEVGRFLMERTSFRRVPLVVGSFSYLPGASADSGRLGREPSCRPVADGRAQGTAPTIDAAPNPRAISRTPFGPDAVRSLALVQTYVESVGDGWTYVLRVLSTWASHSGVGASGLGAGRPHRVAPTADAPVPTRGTAQPGEMEDVRRLGERTGEMHAALASDGSDPSFAPEPVTREDVEGWRSALLERLDGTDKVLRARRTDVPPDVRRLSEEFAGRVGELVGRADGFRALVGTAKIRVHGDYHLGQTLRTADEDWVILDFEGEPARSMAERRAKTSPLKDVAGMLRSFGYASGAALRAETHGAADQEDLAAWEESAREAFLRGYRAATVDRGAAFVPTEQSAFDAALGAWELDKALYEVHYELNNRPDWLALPLAAILRARGTA